MKRCALQSCRRPLPKGSGRIKYKKKTWVCWKCYKEWFGLLDRFIR